MVDLLDACTPDNAKKKYRKQSWGPGDRTQALWHFTLRAGQLSWLCLLYIEQQTNIIWKKQNNILQTREILNGQVKEFHVTLLLPPTVAKRSVTFTFGHLCVGISLCLSKILYKRDKYKTMVPINSWQPHEHHGTLIHGQLYMYTKTPKMKQEP